MESTIILSTLNGLVRETLFSSAITSPCYSGKPLLESMKFLLTANFAQTETGMQNRPTVYRLKPRHYPELRNIRFRDRPLSELDRGLLRRYARLIPLDSLPEQSVTGHRRREIMLPILAYRIQELSSGGLRPEIRAKLQKAIGSLNRDSNSGGKILRTGTRIVREWKGKIHEVSITDAGYEYEGQVFKSLSPIACQITGTHWSGPAFFGTKGKKTTK